MSRANHVRRQQLLREAEGYLDLATAFSDRWGLDETLRDRLAQRALRQLAMAKKIRGNKSDVLYLEGEALRTQQRWTEAAEPLAAALREDAAGIHVHLALAWCYKRIDRLDLAIQTLEDALTVDPTEAIVHYNLACYWSLAGNVRLALNYLTEAFDLDPDYRELVAQEEDFDPIRHEPAFQTLTSVIV